MAIPPEGVGGVISTPPKPGSGLIIGPQGNQSVLTNCCDKAFIPAILNSFVQVQGGPFSCVAGTYELFYLPSFDEWVAYDPCESCKNAKIYMVLKCNWPGGEWTLRLNITAPPRKLNPAMIITKENCDSFELDFSGTLFLTWPITVTIRPFSQPPPQPA